MQVYCTQGTLPYLQGHSWMSRKTHAMQIQEAGAMQYVQPGEPLCVSTERGLVLSWMLLVGVFILFFTFTRQHCGSERRRGLGREWWRRGREWDDGVGQRWEGGRRIQRSNNKPTAVVWRLDPLQRQGCVCQCVSHSYIHLITNLYVRNRCIKAKLTLHQVTQRSFVSVTPHNSKCCYRVYHSRSHRTCVLHMDPCVPLMAAHFCLPDSWQPNVHCPHTPAHYSCRSTLNSLMNGCGFVPLLLLPVPLLTTPHLPL